MCAGAFGGSYCGPLSGLVNLTRLLLLLDVAIGTADAGLEFECGYLAGDDADGRRFTTALCSGKWRPITATATDWL